MGLDQNMSRPPLVPMSEADLEREALAWLEQKEAVLRRKKSNFKPRGGHPCGHRPR